jgi:vancomycin permeability regulator SanA
MAKHNGMDAIAYNAANTNNRYWKLVMFLRERGSHVKAVMGGIY